MSVGTQRLCSLFWIRVPYTQLDMHKWMNGRRHKSTPAARFHPHLPLVRHERTGEKRDNKKLNHELEQTRTQILCSIVNQRGERHNCVQLKGLKRSRDCFLMGKEENMELLWQEKERSTQPQECTAAARANWGLSTAGELESTLRCASPQSEQLWPYKGTLDLRFRFFPLFKKKIKNHPERVSPS